MDNNIYPIGIKNFEKIRKGGYAYVDKTALVYQLAKSGSCFFLNRPRRFGKSLLLSTLEAYFLGKRELFEGLALAQLEKEWAVRPVFHLDLNMVRYNAPHSLDDVLHRNLTAWERFYGVSSIDAPFALRFATVIERSVQVTGYRVAILIDEYDKPLLQSIGNDMLQPQYLKTLNAFYGVLKSMEGSIEFALMTGITKAVKEDLSDSLNSLDDISLDSKFFSLCGFTGDELRHDLKEGIVQLAENEATTVDETIRRLTQEYGGYCFAPNVEGIYNPISMLHTLNKMKFGNYWFSTDTPVYLVQQLKSNQYDLELLEQEENDVDSLNGYDGHHAPISALFQSGYLTIKNYDQKTGLCHLGFPNREAAEGFLKYLLSYYVRFNKVEAPFELQRFAREIERGQPAASLKRLQSFFEDLTFDSSQEQHLYYRNILFVLFRLVGFYMQVNYRSSSEYVDVVLQSTNCVYILLFTLDGTAEEALQEIEAQQYDHPFVADPRRVIKIGVSFSTQVSNIGRWLVKQRR